MNELPQQQLIPDAPDVREYVPQGIPFKLTSPRSVRPGHQHFGEVTLSDIASVPVNAALGNVFLLTATGNRTLLVPSNPQDNFRITIKHKASGAARTLALTTGSAGAFRFGTTITALSATTDTLTDYIDCVYNAAADRWDVVMYTKGF